MSEQTKISWRDSTINLFPKPFTAFQLAKIAGAICFEVDKIMARIAKCQSVGNFKSQFRKLSERFNVMGAKVSAASIAAFLAGEIVAGKNSRAPILIASVTASIQVALFCTVFPCVVVFAAHRVIIGLHFQSGFRCVFYTNPILVSAMNGSNLRFCFRRVMSAFECRRYAVAINTNFHSTALEARRIFSVTASRIIPKIRSLFPSFAAGATLLPSTNQRFELFKSQTSIFCGRFHSSNFSL